MVTAYLNLGSNQNRAQNLRSAITDLNKQFRLLAVSPAYESEAVGFEGDSFYNLCVAIETELSPQQINNVLHQIEDQHGRDRSQPKFSGRTLDIDLILYDDLIINEGKLKLPREDILKYAFVLKPLVDIAANQVHPQLKQSFQSLWDSFDQETQPIVRLEFDFSS
jgi:2-amino-4-hydroxy-6-hydroxymethyldihydropteridine diphosphokinase